ncbi:hypothetical protein KIPB_005610, partial [Kipferlia bialata]
YSYGLIPYPYVPDKIKKALSEFRCQRNPVTPEPVHHSGDVALVNAYYAAQRVSDLVAKVASLQADYGDLLKRFESIRDNHGRTLARLKSVTEELGRAKGERGGERRGGDAEGELAEMRVIVDSLRSERAALEEESARHTAAAMDLATQLDKARDRLTRGERDSMEQAERNRLERAGLEAEIQDLRRRLSAAEAQGQQSQVDTGKLLALSAAHTVESLQADLVSAQSREEEGARVRADLEAEVATLKARASEAEARVESQAESISSLETQRERDQARLAALETEVSEACTEREAALAKGLGLQTQLDEAKARVEEYREAGDALRAQLGEAQMGADAAKGKLVAAEREVETMKIRETERERAMERERESMAERERDMRQRQDELSRRGSVSGGMMGMGMMGQGRQSTETPPGMGMGMGAGSERPPQSRLTPDIPFQMQERGRRGAERHMPHQFMLKSGEADSMALSPVMEAPNSKTPAQRDIGAWGQPPSRPMSSVQPPSARLGGMGMGAWDVSETSQAGTPVGSVPPRSASIRAATPLSAFADSAKAIPQQVVRPPVVESIPLCPCSAVSVLFEPSAASASHASHYLSLDFFSLPPLVSALGLPPRRWSVVSTPVPLSPLFLLYLRESAAVLTACVPSPSGTVRVSCPIPLLGLLSNPSVSHPVSLVDRACGLSLEGTLTLSVTPRVGQGVVAVLLPPLPPSPLMLSLGVQRVRSRPGKQSCGLGPECAGVATLLGSVEGRMGQGEGSTISIRERYDPHSRLGLISGSVPFVSLSISLPNGDTASARVDRLGWDELCLVTGPSQQGITLTVALAVRGEEVGDADIAIRLENG